MERSDIQSKIDPRFNGIRIRGGDDYFVKGFTDSELNLVYYNLTAKKADEYMLFESADFDQIDEFYNPGDELVDKAFILEAITIQSFSRTAARMSAVVRVMNKHLGENITALEPIVGKPKKTGNFAYVTVQLPFSDGQTVSVVFHSPEGDKKKIGPSDQLIAFRWLLNKRDITMAVAPEDGKEVSLEEISKRIAKLVEKNSKRFVSTQKDAVEEQKRLDTLTEQAEEMDKANQAMAEQLTQLDEQAEAADLRIKNTQERIEKQKERNAELEAEIAALRAKQKADEGRKQVIRSISANADIDIELIEKNGGYAAILADEEKQKKFQDMLDSALGERMIQVRNALRGLGWEGERYKDLSKNGTVAKFEFKQVGAGRNVVGYSVNGIQDMLNMSAASFAAKIDSAAGGANIEEQNGPKLDDVLVEWKPRTRGSFPPEYRTVKAGERENVFHFKDITDLSLTANATLDGVPAAGADAAKIKLAQAKAAIAAGYEQKKVKIGSLGVMQILVKDNVVLTNDAAKKLTTSPAMSKPDSAATGDAEAPILPQPSKYSDGSSDIGKAIQDKDLPNGWIRSDISPDGYDYNFNHGDKSATVSVKKSKSGERYIHITFLRNFRFKEEPKVFDGTFSTPEKANERAIMTMNSISSFVGKDKDAGGEVAAPKILPSKDQIGNPAKRIAKLLYSLGIESKVMKPEFYAKVPNDPYLDLVIETHRSPEGKGLLLIHFTHYIKEGGDQIIDSEVSFLTSPETGYLKFHEFIGRGPRGNFTTKEQSMAQVMTKNLIGQGFDKKTANVISEGESGSVDLAVKINEVLDETLKSGWEKSGELGGKKNIGENTFVYSLSYKENDGKIISADFNVYYRKMVSNFPNPGQSAKDTLIGTVSIDENDSPKDVIEKINNIVDGYDSYGGGEESDGKTLSQEGEKENAPRFSPGDTVYFYHEGKGEYVAANYRGPQGDDKVVVVYDASNWTLGKDEIFAEKPAEPEKEATTTASPAVNAARKTLQSIIDGDYDNDPETLDALLDQAAETLEGEGVDLDADEQINAAADRAAELAIEAAKAVQ